VTYQYQEEDQYHFMDTSTFEDIVLSEKQLGDAKSYLVDNLELDIVRYNDEPISVELPEKLVLRITYTEPGYKGDTATGGTKPATTETGLVVQVPLFVTTDDLIRVNTSTGTYVERV
jgi:elongation factor P